MAAGRALHYAGQLVRRKGKRVVISLSSATTARDLQPTRPGETRPLKTFKSVLSSWLSVVSFYPRYHLLKWSPAARIRYTD